jgi:hypothetical protein
MEVNVSFTHQPLYPQGKNLRCPLNRGLSGHQSISELKISAPTGNGSLVLRSTAIVIPTTPGRQINLHTEEKYFS